MKTWGVTCVAIGACAILAGLTLIGAIGFASVIFVFVPGAVLLLGGIGMIAART